MTASKVPEEDRAFRAQMLAGEAEHQAMARTVIEPFMRHGVLNNAIADKMLGKLPGNPNMGDYALAIQKQASGAITGELSTLTQVLMAQALSLDTMFTEFARRATVNMGDYPQASERYARLAFKAQSSSRAAIEALARLHQPREQIVKHVHVNEGGQAVVADEFHQHAGGNRNAKANEQSDATASTRQSSALPGPDPLRDGVPIPGCQRQAKVPDARRD
jgi:hypothetical protein